MNWKLIGLGVVLAGFAVLTGYALWQFGYVGLFEQGLANAATIQLSTDLTIALSLVAIWMVRDARERGVGVLPYLVITLFAGSFGPLLYLFRRERALAQTPHAVTAHARGAVA